MREFFQRKYFTLEESAKHLGISKEYILQELSREALVYLKCKAISKLVFNDNDYDIDKIRWIEGFFWLPIDSYLDLKDLLEEDNITISFSTLMPQIIKVLKTDIFFWGTQRCHAACNDWLYIKGCEVCDYQVTDINEIYFWEETLDEFAEKEGLIEAVDPSLLPTDVVIKQYAKKIHESNKLAISPTENSVNEKDITPDTIPKRKRADPVREVMLYIKQENPAITEAAMWRELEKMAESAEPPFIYKYSNGGLSYQAGASADAENKTLTRNQFNKRFKRLNNSQ